MKETNLSSCIRSEINNCFARIRNEMPRNARLRLQIQPKFRRHKNIVTLTVYAWEQFFIVEAEESQIEQALQSVRQKFLNCMDHGSQSQRMARVS